MKGRREERKEREQNQEENKKIDNETCMAMNLILRISYILAK